MALFFQLNSEFLFIPTEGYNQIVLISMEKIRDLPQIVGRQIDWQHISDTFWSPSFWLVPNTTWTDFTADPRSVIQYTDHRDLLWTIPIAIVVLIIRYCVRKFVFTSFGKALGVKTVGRKQAAQNLSLDAAYKKCHRITRESMFGLLKQVDMTEREIQRWWRNRRAQDKPSTQDKFSESLWRFLHYLFSVVFGLYVLWDKPWLWDVKQCWYGYPAHQSLDHNIRWLYLFSITNNWAQFMSHFFDIKRKDFWIMFFHHVIALLLLTMSWICNFHRVGSLVIVTLDFAECFLEAAKMAKYTNHHKLCNGIFVLFIIAWFATRLGFYLHIIYSAIYDISSNFPTFPAYYALSGMLIMVLGINIIWTQMVLKIAYNSVKSGQVERDCRSSSSELQSDSDLEHMVCVPSYDIQHNYGLVNRKYLNWNFMEIKLLNW